MSVVLYSQTHSNPSIEVGTATHVLAAFSPEIAGNNGSYLIECRVARPDEVLSGAGDVEGARRLWALSEEMVGEKFEA